MTDGGGRNSFWTDVWSFGREILIVVIGVALGLWAQQLASDAGWRDAVATTRKSLNDELDIALSDAWRKRLAQPCTKRFADAAEVFLQRPETVGDHLMPKVAGVQVVVWSDAAWRSAVASQATAHMTPEELGRYADAYDFVQSLMSLQDKLLDTLPQLRTVGDGRRVADERVIEDRLVALGRFRSVLSRENNRTAQLINAIEGELKLKPDAEAMAVARTSAAQCQARAEEALGPIGRPQPAPAGG